MSLDVGVTSLVRDAGLGTLELSMAVFIADTDTAYWRHSAWRAVSLRIPQCPPSRCEIRPCCSPLT